MRCPCTPSQALPQETDGNLERASLLGMCKVQRVLCYVLPFQPSVPREEATISSSYSRPTGTPFNKGLDHCSLPWSTVDRPNLTFSCFPDSPETIFPPQICMVPFSTPLFTPPPHIPSVTRRLLRQGFAGTLQRDALLSLTFLPSPSLLLLQRIPWANWRG